jgi:hypothetical protein
MSYEGRRSYLEILEETADLAKKNANMNVSMFHIGNNVQYALQNLAKVNADKKSEHAMKMVHTHLQRIFELCADRNRNGDIPV